METNYALISDGICVNTIVSNAEFALAYAASEGYIAVVLPDGYGIGDYYDGETWSKQEQPEPPALSPTEQRKLAYQTQPIIEWENTLITIDMAAESWVYYSAENSPIANDLSDLITQAKQQLREMYPD